jgi:hypothetical protein
MLSRFHLLAAVCLSAGAGLFTANTVSALGPAPQLGAGGAPIHQDMQAPLPAGIMSKDLNADKAVEKSFTALTEDAMSKTGFDNLVAKLNDQDRDRIKESLKGASTSNVEGDKNKRLTDLIADIDGSWKSKYGQSFNIDYSKVFTPAFVHVLTGEVSDPQQLVGKWPVDPTVGRSSTAGKVTQSDADIAKSKTFGGNVNLEKGRNVAIAHFMSSGEMGGINASLIHEATGWKFDIPNNVSGQKLYNNLVDNLTYIDQHKDQWPADVNEGYRQVAHAVVSAIYDVPLTNASGTASDLDKSAQPSAINK